MRLHTTLCDLLGTKYPIVQAGMGRLAQADLAGSVSAAGGLGLLGTGLSPDLRELVAGIQQIRARTDRPFGVNLLTDSPLFHQEIDDEQAVAAQQALNGFRREMGMELRPTSDIPRRVTGVESAALVEIVLEHRVPVLSIFGPLEPAVAGACHARGIKILAMASTVSDALELQEAGADAIILQGAGAGGHRAQWRARPGEQHLVDLVPLLAEGVARLRVPIIAAGGISNGRGIAGVLAMGAAGALLGTRFLASAESKAPRMWKDAMVTASSDATTVTRVFTGLPARVLRNEYLDRYEAERLPILPPLIQRQASDDIALEGRRRGDPRFTPLYAGQSVGGIIDAPPAEQVLLALIAETREALVDLRRSVDV
jgi:nitronate monooxygenase